MNFDHSYQIVNFIRSHISDTQEEIWVLAFDSQIELIEHKLLFKGTLDRCLFHPRDLFHFLIHKNAHQFMLVHNHISENSHPSIEDIQQTKKLVAMTQIFEIPMTDHLILSRSGFFSFHGEGLLKSYYQNKNYLRNFRE